MDQVKKVEGVVAETSYSTVVRKFIGGNEYLMFSSAPAVTVLLVHLGMDSIFLMCQEREDTPGKSFYKTVGGYLKPREEPKAGVKRNLLDKVGVTLFTEPLQVGFVSGYGDAIKVPITPFVARSWAVTSPSKFPLKSFDRHEVKELLLNPDLIYDDATRIQLLQFLAHIG